MSIIIKKTISLFIVVALLLSMGNVCFRSPFFTTASASDDSATDIMSELQFDYSGIEEFVHQQKNKAVSFNYLQYLGNHYTSQRSLITLSSALNTTPIGDEYVEGLLHNAVFVGDYITWKSEQIISDPSVIIEGKIDQKAFYDSVLLRLLNSELTSDNAIDWMNKKSITVAMDLLESITETVDTAHKYALLKKIKISELDNETKAFYVHVTEIQLQRNSLFTSINNFGNDLSFVSDALSMAKDIENFAEKIASYLVLREAGNSTIEYLKCVKENTSDTLLQGAIDEVIAATSDSFVDFMKIAALEGALAIGKSAFRVMIGSVWKSCLIRTLTAGTLSTGAVLINGSLIALSLTMTIADLALSINRKLDIFESLRALVALERALKVTIWQEILGYDGTEYSTLMISNAIDLIFAAYDLDCQLCLEMVDVMDAEWTMELLSTQEQREEARTNIREVQSAYINWYNRLQITIGNCGDNNYWIIDENGCLLICGVGVIPDYTQGAAPWYTYKNSIIELHVSDNISTIGEYAFFGLTSLQAPIVLRGEKSLKNGCFDELGTGTLILTDYCSIRGGIDVDYLYCLDAIDLYNNCTLRHGYIKGQTKAWRSSVTVSENGCFYTNSLIYDCDWTKPEFKILQNADVYILNDFEMDGYWSNGSGSNQIYNLFLYTGASIKVGKDISFVSGSYYCCSGSVIAVLGNACITSGTITDLMFKLYGELTVYGKFDFTDQGVGCSWLSVYGALTVYGKYWLCASCGVDSINVYGKLFFYNENESDTGIVNSNFHLRSTAVVYSNSNISFYNGTCKKGCKIYSKGNVQLSDSVDNKENVTLYLNGNKRQTLYVNCYYGDEPILGTLILDNPAGMDFISAVKVQTLFNHNGNPFTLYQNGDGSTFPDYDGDQLTDEKDPHPLVGDIGIPVDIDEGIYIFHNVLNPDKVLSIENNSTEIRANIQLYDALYDQPQKFRVINMGDYYCIQSVYNGLWLDIHSPYDGLGSNIQLWKKNTNTEEKWIFETAGNGNVLIHSLYGYYLGTDGQPENNTNIVTCAFDGTTAQQWALVKTSPYPRAEVADGIYTIHSAADTTKVMDIQDNSTENRANIQLNDDLNSDVQKFIFTKHIDEITNLEYYSIQSVHSGLWLDTKHATSGSTIQLFNENSRKDEKWILEDTGDGNVLIRSLYDTFIHTKNGKTDSGTNVQTTTYNDSRALKWELHKVYSVIFDANGGANAPSAQGKQDNIDLVLCFDQPNRTGYTFSGWNTKADGSGTSYAVGSIYKINADIILYAQWIKQIILGDTDGDDEIGLKDVVQITRYLAGGWDITVDMTAADVNHDGEVNLKDAVLLRRYLAGGWGVQLE